LKFEIVSAHELSLAEQAKVFTDAFTGYIGGSFELDASRLAAFISVQGIDLCYSRFARDRTNVRLAGLPARQFILRLM